jgi:hypothetical protein
MSAPGPINLTPATQDFLCATITAKQLGYTPQQVWSASPSVQFERTYDVPKTLRVGMSFAFEESGTRFSPPPYAVVVIGDGHATLVTVAAAKRWHRWNTVRFRVTVRGVEVRIDFEGHTPVADAAKHVHVELLDGREHEPPLALLARGLKQSYPAASRSTSRKPDWWRRPIFDGGEQVSTMLHLEGAGCETRCKAYCIQGLYERWLRRLEAADVPIGTVCIDVGWSSGGVWAPHPYQWPDLRQFIDNQHRKGRKVLLWIPMWFCEGLPDAWCMRAGKQRLVADPTHKGYRAFLREQVARLVSPGKQGFDADGFKVDMLQYVPCERDIVGVEYWGRQTAVASGRRRAQITLADAATGWGCELLYLLQKQIHDAAKSEKPDCLISSSTAHPYFHDTFDILRLHDTNAMKPDIFTVMKARADLVRAALPNHLIDADNWIHSDYAQWLDYTLRSHEIGVPCIFFAERFVASWDTEPLTTPIPLRDLRRIGRVWRKVFG